MITSTKEEVNMNELMENVAKQRAATGAGQIGPDREANITDEIGTLESNVNAIAIIATVISDLREKIRSGEVGPQCESDAKIAPTPPDMKGRLSAANQAIRLTSEQIHKTLSDIEQLLGV